MIASFELAHSKELRLLWFLSKHEYRRNPYPIKFLDFLLLGFLKRIVTGIYFFRALCKKTPWDVPAIVTACLQGQDQTTEPPADDPFQKQNM
jgi:hypothetical protein